MLAIEIRINGQPKAICGTDDLQQLIADVRAIGQLGEGAVSDGDSSLFVDCYGLRKSFDSGKEIVTWLREPISENDEILFRFVRTSEADDPVEVTPTSSGPF